MSEPTFRERLTANAEDFDRIISQVLSELDLYMFSNERLTAEVSDLRKQLAAREARIQAMRSDIQAVLCDHDGEPCFNGSSGDRKIIRELLEAHDDSPFLREHEARLLEEITDKFENDDSISPLVCEKLRQEAAARRTK